MIVVRGTGGSPAVTLVSPGGKRIATPTEQLIQQTDDAWMMTGKDDMTSVLLFEPAPGRWTVEPVAGSVPVQGVDTADMLPKPVVSASVRRGVLTHRVKPAKGQVVRFFERSAKVSHQIAMGSGKTRFKPAFGPAGRRDIVAQVIQDGGIRDEIKVASYVAGKPARAGRVRGVKLRRHGNRVVVTWKRAANAGGGYVFNGAGVSKVLRGRRVVLRNVPRGAVRVTVQARRAYDEAGGPVTRARGAR
jgi:hypothetical protein